MEAQGSVSRGASREDQRLRHLGLGLPAFRTVRGETSAVLIHSVCDALLCTAALRLTHRFGGCPRLLSLVQEEHGAAETGQG